MPYQGDDAYFCGSYNFGVTHAVTVSGALWNPCGHVLLNTGGVAGWYFHVAEVRGRPKFMRHAGYKRYLQENNKREVSRQRLDVPNPAGAAAALDQLMTRSWTWMLLPNNCARFVEVVLHAGGSDLGLYTNCPKLEVFK